MLGGWLAFIQNLLGVTPAPPSLAPGIRLKSVVGTHIRLSSTVG
jgi:hypothetical protein